MPFCNVSQGKGRFELVDYYFASSFQTLYDEFVHNVCNFIQVGRYHRFWTDMDGKLNVMVVTPQQTSIHPEWRELFDQSSQAIQQQFLNMRHLGRRIGYFITDIRKGTRPIGLRKARCLRKAGSLSVGCCVSL